MPKALRNTVERIRLCLDRLPEIGEERPDWPLPARTTACIIVGIGLAARLGQFLFNRPLWWDEAALAKSLIETPIQELHLPLSTHQAAPIGYLLLQKTVLLCFGHGEYALRASALAAGIASLGLMMRLVYRHMAWPGGLLSLLIFSLSYRLIYFCSEAKPYSLDLLVSLSILWIALGDNHKTLETPSSNQRWKLLWIGIVSVWFSYPSAFVLAGIGLTLIVRHARRGGWSSARPFVALSTAWLFSFAINHVFITQHIARSEILHAFWQSAGAFMPLPPQNGAEVVWFRDKFFEIFNRPVGVGYRELGALAFGIGAIHLWLTRKTLLGMLLLPVLVTLVVSGFERYPFSSRLLLFAVPGLVMTVGYGLNGLLKKATPTGVWGSLLLAGMLSQTLVTTTLKNTLSPTDKHRRFERRAAAYLAPRLKKTDGIYGHHIGRYEFGYYANRHHFNHRRVYYATDDPLVRQTDAQNPMILSGIDHLPPHDRIWVLVPADSPDKNNLIKAMKIRGRPVEKATIGRMEIHLFQSNRPSPMNRNTPPAKE